MHVDNIVGVTFAVSDMARTVAFYTKLGFEATFGGFDSEFTTLRANEAYVHLALRPGYEGQWWGRTIFRVDSADAQYGKAISAGLKPDEPRNAPWGERYFHIVDPDGHELSFAERLAGQS